MLLFLAAYKPDEALSMQSQWNTLILAFHYQQIIFMPSRQVKDGLSFYGLHWQDAKFGFLEQIGWATSLNVGYNN